MEGVPPLIRLKALTYEAGTDICLVNTLTKPNPVIPSYQADFQYTGTFQILVFVC